MWRVLWAWLGIGVAVLAPAGLLAGCGDTHSGSLVKVPDVTHLGLEYGYTRLRSTGLAVSIARFPEHYNERDSFGFTSEVPRAGSFVPRGSTVAVGGPYVDILGRPGMPGKRPAGGMTTVPEVTGLPVYEAMARLQRAGVYSELALIPALEHSTSGQLFDAYIVRRQLPRAGTRVLWAGILYSTANGGAVDVQHSQVTLVPALK